MPSALVLTLPSSFSFAAPSLLAEDWVAMKDGYAGREAAITQRLWRLDRVALQIVQNVAQAARVLHPGHVDRISRIHTTSVSRNT